ncbi:MAG: hypothetical protein JWP46_2361, partial [Modestobacter sp.]|nr:hypothetical protein [Modestobacter sp.]
MQLAGRPVETDLSPADWVAEVVAGAAPDTVAGLLPAVFAGYARLPHPAVRYAGDEDVPVRWAEVAAHNGRRAHPRMQWPAITGSWDYVGEDNQTPLWDDAPAEGHLPVELAGRLVALLAAHTATPGDC